MPELPEVETTILGIRPFVLQQTIVAVTIRQHQLRWPIPETIAQQLIGQMIHTITRRGKYILFHMKNGTLLLHLGMSGRLSIVPIDSLAKKHDHIDLRLNQNHMLRYTDPRRFGAFIWIPGPATLQHPLLCKLGIEPFDPAFNGHYLWHTARKKSMPIKAFIMDQHIVVGVGNIYATEALFQAQLHPRLPAQTISVKQMDRLAQAIQDLLHAAIAVGGTSLKDFLQADGKPGYFKLQLQVYDRHGQPCPNCQTSIEKLNIGQRASAFCPQCQPHTDN